MHWSRDFRFAAITLQGKKTKNPPKIKNPPSLKLWRAM